MFSLYNPQSAFRLAIKKVRIAYLSGTLGAGTIFHCANVFSTTGIAVPTSGTLLTAVCNDAGRPTGQTGARPVGVPRTGSTVTTPTPLGPICSMGAALASTPLGLEAVIDDVDGEIVIEQGYCYQIQAVAAGGSSPVVALSVTWEEVPLVSTM